MPSAAEILREQLDRKRREEEARRQEDDKRLQDETEVIRTQFLQQEKAEEAARERERLYLAECERVLEKSGARDELQQIIDQGLIPGGSLTKGGKDCAIETWKCGETRENELLLFKWQTHMHRLTGPDVGGKKWEGEPYYTSSVYGVIISGQARRSWYQSVDAIVVQTFNNSGRELIGQCTVAQASKKLPGLIVRGVEKAGLV